MTFRNDHVFIKKSLLKFLLYITSPFYLLVALFCAVWVCYFKEKKTDSIRVVFGSSPIINNSYWSKSLGSNGYISETYTYDFFSTINKRSDWDRLLSEEYTYIPNVLKPYIAFLGGLFKYDVFVISFNGFFIGNSILRFWQAIILKTAGKKIIVVPYGSDAYVYRNIRSTCLIHGLMMSYPQAAKEQADIAKNVDYWCRHADAIIPAFMGPDGFGRWDVLMPNTLALNLDHWCSSIKRNSSDGTTGLVTIVHSPNHRGFKGTEFLIQAVKVLKEEGLNIELLLLERLQNAEVRKVLFEKADLLVEQLIITGHGLSAVEGMASGIPTISNLEEETYTTPLRRWSYFDECPLVSASPETLVDVLRKLITRPELRHELGRASREYVEKYHGLDSSKYLFENVIDYVYGRKESIINLYHPLLGEYPNRSAKIRHPLVKNRIVD